MAVTITITEVGRVQGLTSDLDDLLLLGQKWRSQVGDALTTGTLERTMEGASTISLDIHDEDRTLLNSELLQAPFTVELDRLRFAYVKASMAGLSAPLSLTFEAATVDRLRQFKGPRKAFRDKLTRAEFFNRLRLEAAKGWGHKIPFHAPQLHKTQPIKTARDSRNARASAGTERRGGIDPKANLKVKGAKASSAQVAMGDRIMRIGVSLQAPQRALIAAMVAGIVESELGQTSPNLFQLLGSTASSTGLSPTDVESTTRHFFLKGFTGRGGAIANAKKGLSPEVIADNVEGPAAGSSSYAPWVDEARKWVDEYGGEGASISVTDTTRYAYEVEKNETYWGAMTRLAEEVNWRLFESNGRIYYVAEPFLMRSMRRIVIDDLAPGVEDLSFDYDRGKPVNEVSVQARARTWQAPPGTVAEVTRCGPADGRYLVASITTPLRTKNSLCEVTLKRPSKPLKEPAPETETRSVGFGSASASRSASGAPAGIDKMINEIDRIAAKKLPYVWGGGHTTPPAANPSGYDCSGFVSRILYVAGLIQGAVVSGALAGMYQSGPGEWLTIYANSTHCFGKIRTPGGWVFFESGGGGNGGHWAGSLDTGGMTARHPKGY